MLGRIELKLECSEPLSYQNASMFHGALMEMLQPEMADQLHRSQLHPYAQYLEKRNQDCYWVVSCFAQDTVKQIIQQKLLGLNSIVIKKRNLSVRIIGKQYLESSYEELLEHFYQNIGKRYITLRFLTPTAFKQRGKYLFYPDLRCIYQSLMNKYDTAAKGEGMRDEDTLEELCTNSEIVRYNLKSTAFCLEGVKIPSFIGTITIRLQGTQTMANFASMLFEFSEFSGIGIKTALGMGAVKIQKDGGGINSDRKSN